MHIIGLFSWFSEEPADIRRAISSFAPLLDGIVAIDGDMSITQRIRDDVFEAYWEYKDKHPYLLLHDGPGFGVNSRWDQVQAIWDVCEEFGLDCTIMRPSRVWRGETEKLDYCFSLASVKADWFVYIHADFELAECNVKALREELLGVRSQVVWCKEFAVPHDREHRTSRQDIRAGEAGWSPLIVRASSMLSVEDRHWYWFYTPIKGKKVCLTKRLIDENEYDKFLFEEMYRLKAKFLVNHWVLYQDKDRMMFKHKYLDVKNSEFSKTGVD